MRVASRCSVTFVRAVVAMIAASVLLAGETEESLALDDFEPTFVPAVYSIVADDVPEAADPSGDEDGYTSYYDDSCSCSHGGGLDYLLIGRAGADYFSVPGESLFGGLYGVDLTVHLAGDWGFVGSANVNHISHGTQFVGSTGLVKLPDHQGNGWSSPLNFSMVFDQFTDSRVDGLYLNQLRFQLGYALNPCFEVGALYTEPTNRDNDVLFVVPVFNFFTFGTVRQSQQFGGYAAGRLGVAQWSLEASFREKPDTLALGGTLSAPLSDRLGTYVAANYEADPGTWTAAVGLEFRFGASSRSRGWSIAREASYDVVRGQSPARDFLHLVTVPPAPPEPVDGVMGEFERNQLNPEPEILASSWTQRYYFDWLWRQGFISHGLPGRIWRDAGQHKDPSWDTWDLQVVGTDRIRRALK